MGKQLMIKPEKCIGCRTCELVCSFGHDQAFNPRNANVTVMAYEEAAINIPVMCLQCEEPCCLEICPVGAISRDEIGAVVMDHTKCIGCKMCERVCEFDAVKVTDNIAHIDPSKCTNCGKCAEKCPKKVIL